MTQDCDMDIGPVFTWQEPNGTEYAICQGHSARAVFAKVDEMISQGWEEWGFPHQCWAYGRQFTSQHLKRCQYKADDITDQLIDALADAAKQCGGCIMRGETAHSQACRLLQQVNDGSVMVQATLWHRCLTHGMDNSTYEGH